MIASSDTLGAYAEGAESSRRLLQMQTLQSHERPASTKNLSPMPGKTSDRDARIGANIAAARKARGIGQAELARRIGVESATTMWRYEHGWRAPVDKLEAIARECRVTIDELLRGVADDAVPSRDSLTPTQSELLRIAQLGLLAAQDGSQDAIARFNAAVIEHAARLQAKR
jgi:transcriptional regulator with XRE-family HTH domain